MTMASDGSTEQISHVGNHSLETHEKEKRDTRGRGRETGNKMVQNRWRGSFKQSSSLLDFTMPVEPPAREQRSFCRLF